MNRQRIVLPRLLLDAQLADMATLGLATGIAAEGDVSLVHALVRWRLVPAAAVCQTLSEALSQRRFDIDGFLGPLPVAATRKSCVRQRVLPVWREGDLVGLAMSDPTDDTAAREFGAQFRCTVERVLVDDDALDRAIRRLLPVDDGGRTTRPEPGGRLQVVRGEPSGLDGSITDGGDDSLPSPAAVSSDDFEQQSGVFTNRTVDIPMPKGPAVAVAAPPPQLTQVAAIDVSMSMSMADEPALPTRQMPIPAQSSLLFEPTIDVAGLAHGAASDDQTIPNDDLLFLMRVLVVAPEPARTALSATLSRRIKQLTAVALADADDEVKRRRYDEVLVIDPPSGVAGSQRLAALAASAKNGVVVVSDNNDLGRLPGVRLVVAVPDSVEALCTVAVEVLARSARGELDPVRAKRP